MTHSLRALVTILVVLIAAPRLAAQDYAQALDIPYRPADYPSEYARERCRLDVYCPTQTDNFPLVVWFHGGGLVDRKSVV